MSASPRNPRNEARTRAIIYLAIALTMVAAFAVLPRGTVQTSASAHTLLELASALLVLAVGVLALVRHYSRRERQFLFLGATLLGTAVFDALHTYFAFTSGPAGGAGADWSWFASRTFMAVFLFRLAIAPRPRALPADLRLSEAALFGVTLLVTAAGVAVLLAVPMPPLYRSAAVFGQPQELLPGLLLLGATTVNLVRGGWQRNAFEHWLVVSLILGTGGQLLFSTTSLQLYDTGFLFAHVLKTVSYGCIFTGLLASVYFTYRGLEESRRQLTGANVALQNEVREREATERELQIQTAYLERLFEDAPEAIVVLDLENRVLRANAEFTRLFGYEVAEAVGRSINDLVVQPEALAEATELSGEVVAGRSVSVETVRQRKDGTLVPVSILGTPILLADDRVAVYGIYRDITARKHAEDALRQTAEHLEAIINASPLAILTVDGTGVVRTWNPAAERTLGWGTADALGRPLAELNPRARSEILQLTRHARTGEAQAGVEFEWIRPDGTSIIASPAAAPLEWSRAGDGSLLVVLADVTGRHRAEQALREATAAAEAANRAKSEFLASMSHELRTPLNSVIGFTKVLLKNTGGHLRPTDITYLERIAANGEHLLGLINNILDLSKIEAGMMDMELAPVDLAELIRQTVAQLEGRVANAQVDLAAVLPVSVAPFETDAHRMRQVLINLVGNAIKFTEDGRITVTLETANGSDMAARIHVADTGIGIPDDRLAVIFEAFEQADRSTSRRFGGTGLGLSISRAICHQLGYDLTVASEVGRGSTFTIHLPGSARRD